MNSAISYTQGGLKAKRIPGDIELEEEMEILKKYNQRFKELRRIKNKKFQCAKLW
jgi:hypothetical protein